jgi:hypothetical protein
VATKSGVRHRAAVEALDYLSRAEQAYRVAACMLENMGELSEFQTRELRSLIDESDELLAALREELQS